MLANRKRLELLYLLFEKNHQHIQQLAVKAAVSPEHAGIHLRLLSSRGLIRQYRRDMRVLNSTEPNQEVDSAPLLLAALQRCFSQSIPIDLVYRQATAFTHARRIEIIQKMSPTGASKDTLHDRTTISYSALTRHLNKLISRGFVTSDWNFYRPECPPDPFSKALLQTIHSQQVRHHPGKPPEKELNAPKI